MKGAKPGSKSGGGRFHTLVTTSPVNDKTDSAKAYGDFTNQGTLSNMLRKGDSSQPLQRNYNRGVPASGSQMQLRKPQEIAGISTPNRRPGDGAKTGLDIYATASKATYSNQGAPVISQEELKFLRYRPEAKNFDHNEAKQVKTYEDRERRIKDLDTGMSPFMKN